MNTDQTWQLGMVRTPRFVWLKEAASRLALSTEPS